VKILEVTDFYYPWIAGPAPVIRNLSLGLSDAGHDVVIACPSPSGRRFEEVGPPRTHRVRTLPVPFGYNLRAGLPLMDMTNLIRSWRPDVVHVHHPFSISSAAVLAAKAHRVPIVATNHTIPECTLFGLRQSSLYRPLSAGLALQIRMILGAADAVTTPTATAAGMLRDLGFRKSVLPISNGVDTKRFTPPIAGRGTSAKPTILYTGRLDDDKDMETLIQALPRVLQTVDANVRIGGEGTDRVRLERLVCELGMGDRVQFTGYVSHDELPDVYRDAAVYCITSRVELQSISTLEAMASGLPVVAVDAGALPELVKPGVNGCLVSPGNASSFAEGMLEILTNPDIADRYGAASRAIAETHSIQAMILQYERVMRSVALKGASEPVYGAASD
jgi:1,2-diacylglycerol 3-alpha-glucosyltransferase